MDTLETIEACNLKLGRCRHFMKSIKVCEYARSRSFHDDLMFQDWASGEHSQDQWSSGSLVYQNRTMININVMHEAVEKRFIVGHVLQFSDLSLFINKYLHFIAQYLY